MNLESYMKFRFQPEVESDFLQITISMPDGTPFERTRQVANQLAAAEERFMENVNAEYPASDRASDHDPIVVRLSIQ